MLATSLLQRVWSLIHTDAHLKLLRANMERAIADVFVADTVGAIRFRCSYTSDQGISRLQVFDVLFIRTYLMPNDEMLCRIRLQWSFSLHYSDDLLQSPSEKLRVISASSTLLPLFLFIKLWRNVWCVYIVGVLMHSTEYTCSTRSKSRALVIRMREMSDDLIFIFPTHWTRLA